jgi:hypothetical protein
MGDVVPIRHLVEREDRRCPSCGTGLPTTFHMSLDVPGRFLGSVLSMKTKSVTIAVICRCGEDLEITVHNKDAG